MSTPFTSPYSETATFHDLVGEIALAFYQRCQVVEGPDSGTLQANRDVQACSYWSYKQQFGLDYPSRPQWVDYKNYTPGTWPPPLYTTPEQIWAAAGLHPQGFRRATEWDGETEPDWQYGFMQAGDIIGPWIIEDLQKYLSAFRWAYWAGEDISPSGTPTISTIQQYYVGASNKQPTRAEAQADAESFYRLIHTTDYYRTVQRAINELSSYGPLYEATLFSTKLTINFNLSADLIDCAREIILYANVGAHGTFDGFGDYAAPGYNHISDYPAAFGPVPPIELGTADKPLPWHSANGSWGYDARPQILMKWDFTNCNEV